MVILKYNQKIQKLRDMLKIETNTAVRNVIIALLNDAILSHNKQFTNVRQIKDNNRSTSDNYEILRQSPEMIEIISVRKYHCLRDLIGMALKVRSEVGELNIIQKYDISA